MVYSKLMLEDNAIYVGNVCCAKINSGVFLWQQRAPNPAANAQNPWKMFEQVFWAVEINNLFNNQICSF